MKKVKFWNFADEGETDSPASLMLYGELANETWWGDEVTPKDFADDLAALGGKDLEVHINSPGGDVFAGQAIYSQLKAYTGKVNVVIDGMCASAATIVAAAGDTVTMPSNAIFMIHNPMVGVCDYLNEQDLTRMQASLKAIKQTIVNVYMSRVKNLTETQVKNMMNAETWLTADEAVEYGFADVIGDAMDTKGEVFTNCVNYAKSKYKNYAPTEARKEDAEVTLEDIKALLQGKQTAEEAMQEAVKAERERINALNALRDGSEVVNKMVDTAIEKDTKAEDIQAYIDVVKAQPKVQDKGIEEIKAVIEDQKNSGAVNVAPAPVAPQQTAEDSAKQDMEAVIAAMQKFVK